MIIETINLPYSWQRRTAEQLATHINAQNKARPCRLTHAFAAAVAQGADAAEIGLAYKDMNAEYIVNLRDALHTGDSQQVEILINVAAATMGWSHTTLTAINNVLNQLLIVVTPETVTSKLNDAGYQWANNRWEKP